MPTATGNVGEEGVNWAKRKVLAVTVHQEPAQRTNVLQFE
jgi:hypothetical protein